MQKVAIPLVLVCVSCGAHVSSHRATPDSQISTPTSSDVQLDEAIRVFETEVQLNPSVPALYDLAVAYEVVGRYVEARRMVDRIPAAGPVVESVRARIESLQQRLEARARGATDVLSPIGRMTIIEGARRLQDRRRCGGNDMHP